MPSAPAVFDEMGWPDQIRAPYALVDAWLKSIPAEQLALKRREAEVLFRRIGITFAVYTEGGDPERLIPFDLIPRVMAQAEWQNLRKGLEQRTRALNAFIHDVYHDREIIRPDGFPSAWSTTIRSSAPRWSDRICRTTSIRISPASTWCAPGRMSTSCSKTIAARRPACRTWSRTAK